MPVYAGAAGGTRPVGDYQLTCTLLAPLPVGDVFRVFENAGNLARITPPWLNFRVLTPNIDMRPGAEIDYIIRWLGLPMRWKTVITEYAPPKFFVDMQARGPYTLWHHRHEFTETPEGTLVADCVDYKLPLGALGRMAHGVIVGRQLLEIFRYRQKAMPELLGVKCEEVKEPAIRRL